MPSHDNNIDLRLNRGQSDHNESFWPSFTDIMTVIVMIFLLAMVALLVKNTELVNQLRETLASERAASSMAIQVSQEKKTLNKVLAEKQAQISLLENNITQLTQLENEHLAEIEQLIAKEKQQTATLEQMTQRDEQQDATIAELKRTTSQQLADIVRLKESESQRVAQIEKLKTIENIQLANIIKLKNNASESLSTIAELRDREQKLVTSNDTLSSTLAITEQTIETAKTKLAQNTEQIAALQAQNSALRNDKKLLLADLQSQKTSNANQVKQLSAELADINTRVTSLQQAREAQQKTLDTLRQQLSIQTDMTSKTQLALQASEQDNAEKAAQIDSFRSTQELFEQQNLDLQSKVTQLTAALDATKSELSAKNSSLNKNRRAMQALQIDQQRTTQALENALANIQSSEQSLNSLESEYANLKVEYNKLFRPARSKENKYIVKAIHTEGNRFKVAVPGEASRELSLAATDALLAELAKSHCADLYIHIIFPESDKISHAEAWRLTSQLHKHDYYYSNRNCEE